MSTGRSPPGVLTNETVFDLERLPRRLAVLGGGAVGLELAQAFARLGSWVSLVEAERLAPGEEPEVAETLERVLRREALEVRTGCRLARMERHEGGLALHTEAGDRIDVDAVLVATGREPNTGALGLDRAGIGVDDRGFVRVDASMKTSVEGVYAAGDVAGLLPFTHVADEAGRLAAGNALLGGSLADRLKRLRGGGRLDLAAVPWVTFTSPEIGRVGLTEAQAFARHGGTARVAYLPLAETDRGRIAGVDEGFVKLVAGPRTVLRDVAGGRLLGATVMAPTGGDLVHEVAALMRVGAFTGRLAQTVHAYPAWSLALRECAVQFFMRYRGRRARPAQGA